MPRTPLFPARFRLLAMFAALVCADAALARIAAKDEPVTLQQAWNPKPDALDIELPMPCGLKMAFRAVAVPGERDATYWEGFGAPNSADWVYRVPLSMLP